MYLFFKIIALSHVRKSCCVQLCQTTRICCCVEKSHTTACLYIADHTHTISEILQVMLLCLVTVNETLAMETYKSISITKDGQCWEIHSPSRRGKNFCTWIPTRGWNEGTKKEQMCIDVYTSLEVQMFSRRIKVHHINDIPIFLNVKNALKVLYTIQQEKSRNFP